MDPFEKLTGSAGESPSLGMPRNSAIVAAIWVFETGAADRNGTTPP